MRLTISSGKSALDDFGDALFGQHEKHLLLAPVGDEVILVLDMHTNAGHEKLLLQRFHFSSRPFGAKSFSFFSARITSEKNLSNFNLIHVRGEVSVRIRCPLHPLRGDRLATRTRPLWRGTGHGRSTRGLAACHRRARTPRNRIVHGKGEPRIPPRNGEDRDEERSKRRLQPPAAIRRSSPETPCAVTPRALCQTPLRGAVCSHLHTHLRLSPPMCRSASCARHLCGPVMGLWSGASFRRFHLGWRQISVEKRRTGQR